MKRSRFRASGFAFLAILPWAIATVGLALAAAGWIRPRSSPEGAAPAQLADPAEMKTLRLALATSTAENAALRAELDRLLGRGAGAALVKDPAAAGTPGPTPAVSSEQLNDLSAKIRESLSRAAVGDQESARDAAVAMLQALQAGPAAFTALRDAYLTTGDPKARMMMLPTMIFGGGEEARKFIIEQVKNETDPELHRSLLTQAAGFATPQYAAELKDTFLQAASADGDPELRAAAIRGLRFAKGQEVQDTLLGAVSDPSEDIRLAAIENLASRPALRERLREAIAQDPSTRVQEIGHCRLLLAEGG